MFKKSGLCFSRLRSDVAQKKYLHVLKMSKIEIRCSYCSGVCPDMILFRIVGDKNLMRKKRPDKWGQVIYSVFLILNAIFFLAMSDSIEPALAQSTKPISPSNQTQTMVPSQSPGQKESESQTKKTFSGSQSNLNESASSLPSLSPTELAGRVLNQVKENASMRLGSSDLKESSSQKNRKILIDGDKIKIYFFWASWCEYCDAAYKALAQLKSEMVSQTSLEFIGINLDDEINKSVIDKVEKMNLLPHFYFQDKKIIFPPELQKFPIFILESAGTKKIEVYNGFSVERFYYLKKALRKLLRMNGGNEYE